MVAHSRPVNLAASLLSIVLIGFLLKVGQPLFVPLIVAALLCVAFQPMIVALERRRVPWWATVSFVMVVLFGLAAWGGAALVASARELLSSFDQSMADRAREPLPSSFPELGPPQDAVSFETASQDVLAAVRSVLAGEPSEQAIDALKKAAPKAASWLVKGTGAVMSAASDIILVLLFMILIFAEQHASRVKLTRAFGERWPSMECVLDDIRRDVSRYVSLKTILNFVTAIACWIAMVALDVPSAALFALLTFLLGYIPNFGAILAAIPPIAVSFTSTETFTVPLILASIFLVVNVVIGNIVEPAVLGKSLHLSTLVIVVAVLAWTALWGFAGMVLAVPLTRSMQLVMYRLPDLRWIAILMSDGDEELPEGT
ncbi:MAG: AI-2E family transporter [Planctomycetes bacterium]|nr:AI-2E family transporter [Planctomycetota bacterium]